MGDPREGTADPTHPDVWRDEDPDEGPATMRHERVLPDEGPGRSVDEGPGTQPADSLFDSMSTMRPMATQAIFRPNFDDDSEGTYSGGNGTTAPHDHTVALTRAISPRVDSAAGWWRSPGYRRSIHCPR